jgi:NAD(P)-dependent dehydrogenase (short-subunit alcohol dehydrogenase family)
VTGPAAKTGSDAAGHARPLALVTGGCRRIGAAIAAALGEAGYDLALHGGEASEPEPALLARLEAAGARRHHLIANLAEPDAPARLMAETIAIGGRMPALLVNNAAHFSDDRPETVQYSAMLSLYAINCAAPVILARELAAVAETNGAGAVVVNILDQRIAAPHGDQFAYTLSKIALAGATEILARELAPRLRVCAVAPGLTLPTPDYDAARMGATAARMPLRRLADPRAIAEAVLYLARAETVTGQTLYVDGGAHLRHFNRDFVYLD